MGKGFDLEFIEQLKNKNNIVDVISKYVTLDKKGQNYWARCPFHHEKTPSFSVNESGQFYHCFGCGKGGDVISFVKEIESLEYVDAVKYLAERVKMPLPDFNFNDEELTKQRQKKERILSLLKDTARHYVDNLNSGNCDKHIEYIINRQISSNTVRKFGIGASIDFNELPVFLIAKGYSEEELLESGVCDEKNGRIFDSLGGRLIFPIINAFGDVVAFGGRVMEKTDFAKYKNTKETFVFQKSKNLYNLNLLKKQKQETGLNYIIIVEGYMDTISLYQAGFTNVVASMGTSLTKDQARLLKRYNDNVIISYDGDSAGAKATIRGLEILESENLTVKVVSLPDGLDPDDVIKKNGSESYQKLIDEAMPLNDYKLHIIKKQYDLNKPEEKRNYVAKILDVIKTIKSASLQEEYLKKLRDETDITYQSLKKDLENTEIKKPEVKAIELKRETTDSLLQAKRFILASILFEKRYADNFDIKTINFDNNVHNEIVKYIILQKNKGSNIKITMLFELIPAEGEEELNSILSFGLGDIIDGEDAKNYFYDCAKKIKKQSLEDSLNNLNKIIESETDIKVRREIAMQIQRKAEELNALK